MPSSASLHYRFYFARSQGHIFDGWPAAGSKDDDKRKLMDQAIVLDSKYPGGLAAYVAKVCSLGVWRFFCCWGWVRFCGRALPFSSLGGIVRITSETIWENISNVFLFSVETRRRLILSVSSRRVFSWR